MTIRVYKPTTPARRKTSVVSSEDLTKKVQPLKKLLLFKKKSSGRNNTGRITVRHQGGGVKTKIRLIDYKRDKFDVPAKVVAIEYDPNRNARIALLNYADGEKRYIISPLGLTEGARVISSRKIFELKIGSAFPLELIPPGTFVYNVELEPGLGGKLGRAAGNSVVLQNIEGDFAQLKMPSGEIRRVPKSCLATIGQASNPDYRNIRWGKAGRMRHRNIRPTVRGKAMNPVDHPHGGGEGSNPIGLKKGPKNVYGKKALGVLTRRNNIISDKLIIQRRKKRNK
ncbi:MAG TPA: 50S ribosomal protein L2 [Patescibacteria group bacterium]|nr:50S ribosomal protein L2 [Patescibacteria group bacterium]